MPHCPDLERRLCRGVRHSVADLTYAQVAAGFTHAVLLRSDGSAVARGDNATRQCDLPALHADLTYAQVAAGSCHSVLLRSDGSAVTCGLNDT
eukprot:8340915-Pyramimonas_sp.AAC.1